VHRLTAELRECWTGRRISVRSPLSLEEASGSLGVPGVYWRGPDRIAIYHRPRQVNFRGNGWQPGLRGNLTRDGAGCRFDGVIAPDGIVRPLWVLFTAALMFGAAAGGVAAIFGAPNAAVAALVLFLASPWATVVELFSYHYSRDEIDALESWITGALASRP
jgi:hypothetical protein